MDFGVNLIHDKTLSVSVGTVAGLVASIVGTVVFMPAFFALSRQGRGKAL